MKRIDLNCDMGELPEAIADGTQEALMPYLTSVNIACGGHAGDEAMMKATIEQALRHGVAIGAHAGYADRANFGRLPLKLTPEAIAESVYEQVCGLAAVAERSGARLGHVKPHGALYNQAAKDAEIASAIANGVARWRGDVTLVGLGGSRMLEAFRVAGFPTAAEAFADRVYEGDGSLRSRTHKDALIEDPTGAAKQALRIAESGTVIAHDGREIAVPAQTICIHGDTLGAVRIAEAVAAALWNAGIALKSLGGRGSREFQE
jgi:5-oxoprolinase (ATP-hydrolysing) subunit A